MYMSGQVCMNVHTHADTHIKTACTDALIASIQIYSDGKLRQLLLLSQKCLAKKWA